MISTETLALLRSHRSIRKFKDKALPAGLLEEILVAGQCAATSSFLQGATIIRVTDKAKRQQLAEAAGNQPYVSSAAEFMVF